MFNKTPQSLLADAPLAKKVPARELRILDQLGTVVHLRAGKRVIQRDGLGRQCFVVISGTFDVRQGDVTVAQIRAGEFAGEMALLSGDRCNADVVANDDAVIYALSRRDFRSLLSRCPELAAHIQKVAEGRTPVAA